MILYTAVVLVIAIGSGQKSHTQKSKTAEKNTFHPNFFIFVKNKGESFSVVAKKYRYTHFFLIPEDPWVI